MKKLISEDNTMYNVNRQQYGVTARQDSKGETAPQANNTKTFLNANKRDDKILQVKKDALERQELELMLENNLNNEK